MGAPVAVLLDEVSRTAKAFDRAVAEAETARLAWHRAVIAASPHVKPQEIADAARRSRGAIHHIVNSRVPKKPRGPRKPKSVAGEDRSALSCAHDAPGS